MGSIEQVFDEVKDAVGDKGFIVIIAGLAGLFIYANSICEYYPIRMLCIY